ncbi:ElyC/SanA/YdcF family protein [Butyrivibrio sp. FC2001]|uniref:ElyC/SanA/YdcF family protein n=1 Tax=Butyrivibrio sp. FC2001 TaxID=1280671 RepID=UPI0003FCEDE9|nr:ElyC/SanA/YdcF family protein [Butyrivibrio sp. FC2001]
MTYRFIALFWIAVFYGIYFTKMFIQRRKGIVTNQIAKSKVHDKSYHIEMVMKYATIAVPVVEVISIVLGTSGLTIIWRVIGMHLAFLGNVVFLLAVITMKDSWRAGVAREEKRGLIKNGIYKYSRNPAFLGFDLVYIGIMLMFYNPVLMVITVWAMVMLHLQILQEEKYLEGEFGDEYTEYKAQVSRYAGCGKVTFDKAVMYVYFVLGIWSVMYFFTCLAYGGGLKLSWVWLWILIAAFSFIRVFMQKRKIEGSPVIRLPKVLVWIYRAVFVALLTFFIFTETKIIGAMTAEPKENLDYIIVLGAGLRGTEPSNPFRVRIEKAAQYLKENEGTIVVASGGQGKHESISEAECARRKLTEVYGISEDRIILEEKSTDTEENLKYSLEIIGDPSKSAGIVTNGFHELRALSIANEVGYENVSSVPAVTLMPVGIHYTVREFFGMVEFYLKH